MSVRFRVGDMVEVLDAEEILATLDDAGAVDNMPFMPEMLKFCGGRFRISSVAHKTCDTVCRTGGRAIDDCYHLEDLRCDGSAHGGCQATCLIFWKGSWLTPALDGDTGATGAVRTQSASPGGCDIENLQRVARRRPDDRGAVIYSCQATRLFDATRPLKWWDPRQYVRDVAYGNARWVTVVQLLVLSWVRALMRKGIAYRWTSALYLGLHRAMFRREAPMGSGEIPIGQPTPVEALGLRPGDLVRVKSHEEIRATLSVNSKNRGLWFDHEYVPYCETEQQVSHLVQRIVDERSGEMIEMKTPCIALMGVHCKAKYSEGRLLCPRAITAYWREIWLERVAAPGSSRSE